MARESESPPSAPAAVGGDASGDDGGRPKKAKARRPTDLLTQAVEPVLDGVAAVFVQPSCGGGGVRRLGDAVALIKRYDMAVLAGKLQDTISATQLRCTEHPLGLSVVFS